MHVVHLAAKYFMNIKIRCRSKDNVRCPVCGTQEIVSQGKSTSHCGNCGMFVAVEIDENLKVAPEPTNTKDTFNQLSLFDIL